MKSDTGNSGLIIVTQIEFRELQIALILYRFMQAKKTIAVHYFI